MSIPGYPSYPSSSSNASGLGDSSSSDGKKRLYHPYQDLNVPIHNLYHLPTSPDFLEEEALRPGRSWGENIQYYSGIGYLTGAVIGAGKGSVEGLRAAERGESLKLRINRFLNASGRAGGKLGNFMGIVGLIFAGLESGIVAMRDNDDTISSVIAGLGTGVLYRAASGPRSAAFAGAAFGRKHLLKRYVPL
ncbi:hypothetical protein H6P81_008104 [Aristolochia fimbriata]|uniref:Uncharacterized protein n=1 Tax=Aristolochia fimbriata TaxID=158543 RepID=A0AAV7F4F2_ARIFI|nr:hypothetical protein H6P81_008104 [Aristolochia fimbriata]